MRKFPLFEHSHSVRLVQVFVAIFNITFYDTDGQYKRYYDLVHPSCSEVIDVFTDHNSIG